MKLYQFSESLVNEMVKEFSKQHSHFELSGESLTAEPQSLLRVQWTQAASLNGRIS